MAANQAQVLIVSVPGRIYETLQTLLNSLPGLEVQHAVKGHWPSPGYCDQKTDLVLLDCGRPDGELMADLAWIRTNWPLTRCIVLADRACQLQAALSAGADAVLLKGYSIGEFFKTIRYLLKTKIGAGLESTLPR